MGHGTHCYVSLLQGSTRVPMIECKTTNFTNPSSTQYQNIWNYIHSVFLWPIIHVQTGNRFPVRELTTCSPIKRFCFTHTGALDIGGTPRLCNTRLRRICTSKTSTSFQRADWSHHLPTSWIGTLWIVWESKVCLEMNVNAYFIIYYIKNILYIIYIRMQLLSLERVHST